MTRVTRLVGVLLLAGCFAARASGQTTWHVDAANCPGPGSGTVADPFCSIQDGIIDAINGDSVEVAPGTYIEAINLLGKAIILRSSAGAGVTTINGGGTGTVVTCESGEGPGTIIDGFTIANGTAVLGGGMLNTSSSPTVLNCIFVANRALDFGAGMFNSNSTVTVTNCLFWENISNGVGGAMFNQNSAPIIINCTILSNKALVRGGAIYNDTSFPTITNCILWQNDPEEVLDVFGSTSTISYSDILDGWPGVGNIDIDPLFVDDNGGDLRLNRFSPCTDAADNDAVPAGVATDLDGNPRFHDDAGVPDTGNSGVAGPPVVDMGAFERQIDSEPITIVVMAGESIQAAIDAAFDGDEIVVSPGTYNEAINFNGKAITLRSTDPSDPAVVAATIIDGTGNFHVVQCVTGEGPDTVLAGFTITGGNAQGISPDDRGGGMYNDNSSPTVTNCTFVFNIGVFGGGMHNTLGSPTVTNCTFSSNLAALGGGMLNLGASPTVTNCTFSGNTAGDGGGMYNGGSSPTVTNCTFSGNMTNVGSGGGMFNTFFSSPTVTNCTFSGNSADEFGGGMHNLDSSPTVTNCTFSGNTVGFFSGGGGGMYNENSSSSVTNCTFVGNTAEDTGGGMHNLDSSPTVTNCTFSGNETCDGGGMYNESGSPTLTNCTFSGNDSFCFGGGMFNLSGNPVLTNCILWGNLGGEIFITSGAPVVTFSDIQGGFAGTGNIDADPLFVDADGPDNIPGTEDDDLHLLVGSPCINVGDDNAPNLPATDIDGEARIQQCRVDMGADETPFFLLDCNASSTADECDIADGTSLDLNGNGVPDECEGFFAYNITQDTLHPSIADAIAAAIDGDVLLAPALAFQMEPNIDFISKAITLRGIGGIDQPSGGLYVMGDNSALESAPSQSMTLGGDLQVPFGALADILTSQLTVGPTGSVTVGPGAGVLVEAGAGISNSGSISLFGVLDSAAGLHNQPTGTMTVSGFIFADVTNDNQATFNGDSYVIGDYLNNGTTDINNGTLTIFGTLTNNGTINGTVSGGAAASGPGDDFGLAVLGDLVLGPSASLLMPSPQLSVRVEGNHDVAINDNSRFDMVQAELRMVGLGEVAQNLEMMSTDIGSCPRGLDRTLPGHFPVGTLRIGPTPTIVSLLDDEDNDGLGQTGCEAIYAQNLIIEAGATLNTNTCKVYYGSLTLDGLVDDPDNLIQVEAVPGDLNGDCRANLADYGAFSDCFSGPDVSPDPSPPITLQQCLDAFDFDGDLDVDLVDFGGFQHAFTGE